MTKLRYSDHQPGLAFYFMCVGPSFTASTDLSLTSLVYIVYITQTGSGYVLLPEFIAVYQTKEVLYDYFLIYVLFICFSVVENALHFTVNK